MNDGPRIDRRKRVSVAVTSATTVCSSFIDVLGAAERDALIAQLRPRTYAKGRVVFNDGDRGDALHLVQSGRLDVQTATSSGAHHHLSSDSPR
jgi:CRP-like cAMP-binding protein